MSSIGFGTVVDVSKTKDITAESWDEIACSRRMIANMPGRKVQKWKASGCWNLCLSVVIVDNLGKFQVG